MLGEVTQVENVNAEQPKEHDGLRPLRGIAPEHARVLDDNGAGVGARGKDVGETLEESGPDALRFALAAYSAGPGGAMIGWRDHHDADRRTPGGDYSADVMERAAVLRDLS